MNRKIYFNKNYILLTQRDFQQTENQVITYDENSGQEWLSGTINNFIQQTEQKPLILISKDSDALFERLKSVFHYIEAAGGLIKKDDRYLFIYRLEKWDLPKGKIDPGETPTLAAIRECQEECGIQDITIKEELPSTFHIYAHKGRYVLKKTFWYLMHTNFNDQLIPQLEENIEKAEWLNPEQVRSIVLPNTYPSVEDLILHSISLN